MRALNFIDGAWSGNELPPMEGVNPSTGESLLMAPRSGAAEVDAAAAAAARAFDGWASTPPPARGDILFRAAEIVEREAKTFSDLITEEVGKPIAEARAETARLVAILRYFAGEGRRAGGQVLPADGHNTTLTLRVPLGVVGLITPWNFPVAIPAWKLSPALVAGNAVVFKPAEQAPASAALLVRTLHEAGVPAGVLNIVQGDAEAGAALVNHPAVRAVSFTGSNAAGAEVRRAAAERGIRCQVEMGGKNAAVVLADADLQKAAVNVATGAFGFAGQKCTATGLVLVEEAVAGPFGEALSDAVSKVVVGSPFDEATACGPVIDEGAVERAVAAGAARIDTPGLFVRPCVRTDVALDDPLFTEEQFTPVVPVATVASLEESLNILNGLPTGLAASLHATSAPAIWTFLQRAQAGVLAVNRPTTGLEVQAPFGGLKGSGSEHKEQGQGGIDFYTELKTAYWAP